MQINKFLVKGYKEFKDYFSVNVVVLNDDDSFNREITIKEPKETMSKEILDKLIQESSLKLKKMNADQKLEEAKKEQALVEKELNGNNVKTQERNKTLRTISKVALVALLTLGGAKLIKEFPSWINNDNNKTSDPNANSDNSNNNDVVSVEVVTVSEQKKFYTEVDEVIFKDTVDSIIEEYAIQGFEADYKGVSATLFFANMQSIDASVVEGLIDAEYLENDFVQNMTAAYRLNAVIGDNNDRFTYYKEDVKFMSVAPFMISNQKDYENIIYSEQLLNNIANSESDSIKVENFSEYNEHIFGASTAESNYQHGFDGNTIGYEFLNRRFLAPAFNYPLKDILSEEERLFILNYSRKMDNIVGFMNKYDGCFDNVPKTK